ncbi:MAG: GNAT family N-acetyltransferase [Anaerolineae bacterium]|nr:GNAT family N-acetyltransferase [Anaerolineae bacterium]
MDIRPSREGDLLTIVDLINCCAAADGVDCATSILELGAWWRGGGIQLADDCILVEHDGQPFGYAVLDRRPDSPVSTFSEFNIIGGVLPAFRGRGAGTMLIEECEHRALRCLGDVGRRRVSLMIWVNVRQADLAELCRSHDFELSREFLTMEYSCSGHVDTVSPPQGYSIRQILPGEQGVVEQALSTAFRDHWGHPAMTLQEWRHWHPDAAMFSNLTYVALSPDGNVAGVCRCVVNPYQNRRIGKNQGWVEDLGVLRQHRGRGVGRALLLEGIYGLERAGCGNVLLDVDAENPTGALYLYRSVGFRLYDKTAAWRKILRS